MKLKGEKVLVIGAARSGIAAAEFLLKKGAEVTLLDDKTELQLEKTVEKLKSMNVNLALGGKYPDIPKEGYSLIVISPGVPLEILPVVQAKEAGIPVIGELELAYRFSKSPIIAITGTNGKTTTTSLVGKIFSDAGINTLVTGNIGLPLICEVENYSENDVIVLEVSSFQLETVELFKPKVSVILNITPDHLDRHKSMDNYISAKAKIFKNQGAIDYTVLNYDDVYTAKLAKRLKGNVIFFSRKHILDRGVYIQDGKIIANIKEYKEIVEIEEFKLPGAHNLENALAAIACACAMNISQSIIAKSTASFKGVPHRMETVAEINGVRYVNDSKATNSEAAIHALNSFEDKKIILIAGGLSKGSDFTKLARVIKEKVRFLILFGKNAGNIKKAVEMVGFFDFVITKDLKSAVLAAHKAAVKGDVVLLSPACASWDMFLNYEKRGEYFKQLVLELKNKGR
ncbi:UDP-N-acetylmuramoyl-L-alanine--D-glutamate ligase [Peptococcaceae bacterium]|nr:UDP-N-acetylmuramoyl-L-alanine--D-glutamate ligase [Peptococcaceae bacterium]